MAELKADLSGVPGLLLLVWFLWPLSVALFYISWQHLYFVVYIPAFKIMILKKFYISKACTPMTWAPPVIKS